MRRCCPQLQLAQEDCKTATCLSLRDGTNDVHPPLAVPAKCLDNRPDPVHVENISDTSARQDISASSSAWLSDEVPGVPKQQYSPRKAINA